MKDIFRVALLHSPQPKGTETEGITHRGGAKF